MESVSWLQYLSAIGSITTPILVLVLTAVGWKFKTAINRTFELEDKLREDRVQIYNYILEPFIIVLMSEEAWKFNNKLKNKNKDDYALSKMLSLEYKQMMFRLTLIGSDSVVQAYNNLLQYFYNSDTKAETEDEKTLQYANLMGTLLLEIRKSMGNASSRLNRWDMLEAVITDAREIRKKY